MKYIILLWLPLCLFSCGPMGDCKSEAEDLKGDECLLIVQKIPSDTDARFDYKGINPVTKKECDCNSNRSDRWWANYKKDIIIGDTIIKNKGELIFSIHKKDTVLSFNFECDGKLYK
ncbi:hypothetical protein QWY99_07845 [Flavobacterium branchiarum]|uniref:Lipoprotein n=1 Tax=Flavobacterium branchiarum TaxID=1114870 RepID=A0ABV5FQK2_9FLAO|nr:hypothetical protein [Flavobacterium branchiarum]MDN3672963.1 hypothetical protein [Flavobacterium branchiarum]